MIPPQYMLLDAEPVVPPHLVPCETGKGVPYQDAAGEMIRCLQCDAEIGPAQWNADHEGNTCGEQRMRGAFVCACGAAYLGKASVIGEEWKINRGGRSVDTGRARIRIDGAGAEELMKRIVRLPELERLEREIEASRRGGGT